ncbi:RNA polymerase subunit sigma-24 [Sulfitobacter sp. SK012]|uniref:RNA polymerase sigma factor n=1 Tax=Sulfitobacter sp. SK012 TaxID=1389005 RepID=UPI000E0BE97D|nr:RNA polymerase sigma factor [Sulfitobacter sp. SK012]AXI46187.1 RNA polymerase subunit sigma-24 [Sulfitobacter sp. SK012]
MTPKHTPNALEVFLPRLRRRARRLTRTRTEAEDLVQETCLRLLQAMDRAPIAAPEHYGMIIVHNLARQRWRDRHDTQELEENNASTPDSGTARLACSQIIDAINRLPPDQARLMRLVMEGETSPRQLSHTVGCPVGTVMSRLARARARLRREMGLEGSEPVSALL